MDAERSLTPSTAGLKGRAIAGPHDYEQIPALVERGMDRVKDFYPDLEGRLKDHPFVAGADLTAADVTAFVTIGFATNALQLAIPEANAATRRWYDGLAARESFSA